MKRTDRIQDEDSSDRPARRGSGELAVDFALGRRTRSLGHVAVMSDRPERLQATSIVHRATFALYPNTSSSRIRHMSITQLRAPGQAAACIAQARRAVGEGLSVPAGALSAHELGEAIAELSALESQVAAWRLALAAEADVRRVAEETADTDTTAWLMRLTADPREVAAGGILAGPAVAGDLSGDPGGVRGRVVADRAGPGDREGGRAGPGRGHRRATRRLRRRSWWPRPPGSGPGRVGR